MFPLLVAILAASLDDAPVRPGPEPSPAQARAMLERGLAFLVEDAVDWRTAHQCVTCHHGVMTVWALGEARRRGFAVPDANWNDLSRWTIGDDAEVLRTRIIPPPSKPTDTYHVVSLPALYFAQAAANLPDLKAPARQALERLPAHLAEFQKEDGSWSAEEFPAGNRPPPTQESPEVLTLWAYLALERFVPREAEAPSPARAVREKAAAWLARVGPGDTSQAAALRLLVDARGGLKAERLQPSLARLRARQNADGGWSQVASTPSDAYATGQALYALSEAGVPRDDPAIRRAVAFLLARQNDDGSWPMIPRAHPGARPFKDDTAITYFGSAWAILGLVRCVPPPAP